jgi:soluble lytic murein transglycosylase-like protein
MIEAIIAAGVIAYGAIKKKEGDSMPVTDTKKYDQLISKYSSMYGVSFDLIKAIMKVESDIGRDFRVKHGLLYPQDIEKSKSSDGKSWGLMQMTLKTAQYFDKKITIADLNNAEKSIELGTRFLQYLQKRMNGQDEVIRAYNGGEFYKKNSAAVSMTAIYLDKVNKALVQIRKGEI